MEGRYRPRQPTLQRAKNHQVEAPSCRSLREGLEHLDRPELDLLLHNTQEIFVSQGTNCESSGAE